MKKAIDIFSSLGKSPEPKKPKKQLNCFIIMPFSEAIFTDIEGKKRELNQETLKYIYEEYFLQAIKSFKHDKYEFANTHRNANKRGNFVKEIITNLKDYDLVIADLTSLNPNVFYELGIRHTLHAGTILITQEKNPTSDLGNYIKFNYEYPSETSDYPKCYEAFEKKMHDALDEFLEQPDKHDSPVLDFIGYKNIFRNEERIKEIERNIELMNKLQLNYETTIHGYLSNIEQWVKGEAMSANLDCVRGVVKPFLGRLVNLGGNIEVIEFFMCIIDTLDANRNNISYIKKKLLKTRNLEDIRAIPFNVWGLSKQSCHILDLKKYYVFSSEIGMFVCNNRKDEPAIKAFNYIRDKWKKELAELTK